MERILLLLELCPTNLGDVACGLAKDGVLGRPTELEKIRGSWLSLGAICKLYSPRMLYPPHPCASLNFKL